MSGRREAERREGRDGRDGRDGREGRGTRGREDERTRGREDERRARHRAASVNNYVPSFSCSVPMRHASRGLHPDAKYATRSSFVSLSARTSMHVRFDLAPNLASRPPGLVEDRKGRAIGGANAKTQAIE